MPIETLSDLYTTLEEIESIYTTVGVTMNIDDDATGTISATETGYLDDVREEATDICNQYLLHQYNASDLINNLWVRRRCSWIAAYLLSMRGGNAKKFVHRVKQIYPIDGSAEGKTEFERVMNGQLLIPRLAKRTTLTPALSNLVVDDNFSVNKIRVQPSASTGGQYGNQDSDWMGPWE